MKITAEVVAKRGFATRSKPSSALKPRAILTFSIACQFYRKTLLEVFESMPETTFIWKYEDEGSQMAAHLRNVHLSTWLPQNALLEFCELAFTTFFLTPLEATHLDLYSTTLRLPRNKTVPVFADETRNAYMLAKHGGGIVLTKNAFEHPDALRESLQKIFNDASYSHNAKRLSDMLLNQPISAKQLLIRHSEFAAK
ncbi:UDP-glucuronosyltransferase [Trichostrongylus colubriformis]|uniref:glucuronosyltransferase n=1 Tax=Trichostrongylus colubriformis TaxID=6319 RepID=A0AAN8G3S4_TRICO